MLFKNAINLFIVFAETRNFDYATHNTRARHIWTTSKLQNMKIAKSHRGGRNTSGLEAHSCQSLGQLRRIHSTVWGHVRLTSNVYIHFTYWMEEEKGIHVQKGATSTCAVKESCDNLKDHDWGIAQAE